MVEKIEIKKVFEIKRISGGMYCAPVEYVYMSTTGKKIVRRDESEIFNTKKQAENWQNKMRWLQRGIII